MDLFKEILDTKASSSAPEFRRQMADLATAIVKENWDKEHPGCVKVEYILGVKGAKPRTGSACCTDMQEKDLALMRSRR